MDQSTRTQRSPRQPSKSPKTPKRASSSSSPRRRAIKAVKDLERALDGTGRGRAVQRCIAAVRALDTPRTRKLISNRGGESAAVTYVREVERLEAQLRELAALVDTNAEAEDELAPDPKALAEGLLGF